MNNIEFIGENTNLGIIGNFFIALALAAAFLAAFSYYFAAIKSGEESASWKKLARLGFRIHTLGILGTIGTLFYILINHRFEYYYAWQHTDSSLPFKYVFAAFWEGQEGSFLLWMFWTVVIGNILIATSKVRENQVMFVFSLVQFLLVTMVVGIVIDIPGWIDYKIGANPFLLTREHPSMVNMPFVKLPNYLEKLDGRGLNPALQNYWMTIHPPTLFLGFALTLVPYAYAVSAIWKRELNAWTKDALPWAFTAIMILGTGILMGGAWAYEALNFGGFWAWDPVENASLVPWIVLVGAAHLMLIKKNKGTNLKIALVLSILAFILVLYSTFLTRSGVLGDASVHSFTDLGMSGQLLLVLFFFMLLPILLGVASRSKSINILIAVITLTILSVMFDIAVPFLSLLTICLFVCVAFLGKLQPELFQEKEEEDITSREFWIFIGALVLLGSAIHLTFETSKPVINKIFHTSYAPASIQGYNRVQLFFGIAITILIAIAQFFKYKKTDFKLFWSEVTRSLIPAALIVIVAGIAFPSFRNPGYILLTLTSLYGVLANLDFIRTRKQKWYKTGASVAHVGFALIILGSVVSAGHQYIISNNKGAINLEALNSDFKNNENVMLHRNSMAEMDKYWLVYTGDTVIGNEAFYEVNYYEQKDNDVVKAFTLYPKLIMNDRMGNVAEPATKHYLHKDIFTHVTYVDIEKIKRKKAMVNHMPVSDEKDPQHFTIQRGDTIYGTSFAIHFVGFEALSDIQNIQNDSVLNLKMRGVFTVQLFNGEIDTLYPVYEVNQNVLSTAADLSEFAGVKVEVKRILNDKQIDVEVTELQTSPFSDFIIMQAVVFPGINLLWLGCFVMVIGTGLAVYGRVRYGK